jgi:hypothetical protein
MVGNFDHFKVVATLVYQIACGWVVGTGCDLSGPFLDGAIAGRQEHGICDECLFHLISVSGGAQDQFVTIQACVAFQRPSDEDNGREENDRPFRQRAERGEGEREVLPCDFGETTWRVRKLQQKVVVFVSFLQHVPRNGDVRKSHFLPEWRLFKKGACGRRLTSGVNLGRTLIGNLCDKWLLQLDCVVWLACVRAEV